MDEDALYTEGASREISRGRRGLGFLESQKSYHDQVGLGSTMSTHLHRSSLRCGVLG